MKNKITIGFLTFSIIFVFGGLANAAVTAVPLTAQTSVTTSVETSRQANENSKQFKGNAIATVASLKVDINDNGIPDGQEDFDEDGILNKNDVDYLQKYAKDRVDRIQELIKMAKTREAKKLKYALKLRARKSLRKGETLVNNQKLFKRLRGKILLKVQDKGRAYYVNPATETIRSLGRPADAFRMMREDGLGVSNADFEAWKGKAPKRLAGRILLKVQDKGQAYYVNPDNLQLQYLKRPSDAFKLMRELGLGVSNTDFDNLIGVEDQQ